MHILLTRPLEDSSEMIFKLKSLGHQISHLPLLYLEKVNYKEIDTFMVKEFNVYMIYFWWFLNLILRCEFYYISLVNVFY